MRDLLYKFSGKDSRFAANYEHVIYDYVLPFYVCAREDNILGQDANIVIFDSVPENFECYRCIFDQLFPTFRIIFKKTTDGPAAAEGDCRIIDQAADRTVNMDGFFRYACKALCLEEYADGMQRLRERGRLIAAL